MWKLINRYFSDFQGKELPIYWVKTFGNGVQSYVDKKNRQRI
jgi:hypothetical protein